MSHTMRPRAAATVLVALFVLTAVAGCAKNERPLGALDRIATDPRLFLDALPYERRYDQARAPNQHIPTFSPQDVGPREDAIDFPLPIAPLGSSNFLGYAYHGIDRISLFNNFRDSFGTHTRSGDPRSLDGTFLAAAMDGDARLLQQYGPTTRGAADYGFGTVEGMNITSALPIQYVGYEEKAWPVRLDLSVYSPIIAYDLNTSILPVSVWAFTVSNPDDEAHEASVLFSLENDLGWRRNGQDFLTIEDRYRWGPMDPPQWVRNGTTTRLWETSDLLGVRLDDDPALAGRERVEASYLGDLTLAAPKQDGVELTYAAGWNTLSSGHEIRSFQQGGRLPNSEDARPAIEKHRITAGAVAATVRLEPGEVRVLPFFLANHLPFVELCCQQPAMKQRFGGQWAWTDRFHDSSEIVGHANANFVDWFERIRDWQDRMLKSALPPDLFNILLAGLAAFAGESYYLNHGWYTIEGNFGWYETMDVQMTTDWPLLLFWPDVVKTIMRQFGTAVRERGTGQVPHSLPIDFSFYHEEPAFIFRLYRTWAWTRDEAFLHELYPLVDPAIRFTLKRVDPLDGLIHNAGRDTSYDAWYQPTSSYINSHWLAALLSAEHLARHMGETSRADEYRALFQKAQKGMLDRLWVDWGVGALPKGYFRLGAEVCGRNTWIVPIDNTLGPDPEVNCVPFEDREAVFVEALYGDYIGQHMDLDVLPADKSSAHWKMVFENNYDQHHGIGWINGVFPGGVIDFGCPTVSSCSTIWIRGSGSLSSALLRHGLEKESWRASEVNAKTFLYRGWGAYYVNLAITIYYGGTTSQNTHFIYGDSFGYPYPAYPELPVMWAMYVAASGFTPAHDGLHFEPRPAPDSGGGHFEGLYGGKEWTLEVKGSGAKASSATLNGKTWDVRDSAGRVFLPWSDVKGQSRLDVTITLG